MLVRLGFALLVALTGAQASAQTLYTFDDLQPGGLAGQDGWVDGITGSGSPAVVSLGDGLAAQGSFKSAARGADSQFAFDGVFDSEQVIVSFDVVYDEVFGNISIQLYFYHDADGNQAFDSGEGVFGFGLARNTTSIPDLQLQFVGEDVINGDVSGLVNDGDELKLVAEVEQDQAGLLAVSLYIENFTTGSGLVPVVAGITMPEAITERLSDIDSIQIRFDSGNSIIDNIGIDRVPTPCEIADTNGDGVTSPTDFTFWVGCYSLGLDFAGCETADQNGDGLLTPADFTAWVGNFNQCE